MANSRLSKESPETNLTQPPLPMNKKPSVSKSSRRRSTSSVFSSVVHLVPSFGQWDAPPTDSERPKQKPPGDSNLDREVQNEALQLGETETDAIAAEIREREELAEILSQGDWSPSEAALFSRLRRRGREPLLPAPWRLDFATFPEVLYSPVGETSFICALTSSMDFRGSQALQRLVNVGGQVRDRTEINPSAPTEPLIYQEVRSFVSWAEKDGDISLSSILTINYNRDKKGSSKTASERTERKMKSMAKELREKLDPQSPISSTPSKGLDEDGKSSGQPMVVYGITVFNCVAAISSINCHNLSGDVKTLVVLDWTDIGLDIWNAIAIAILIISCRNDILDADEDAGARFKSVQYPDDDA